MRDPFGWGYQDRVRRRYRALKRAVDLPGGRDRLRTVRRAATRTPARTDGNRGRRRPFLALAIAFAVVLVALYLTDWR